MHYSFIPPFVCEWIDLSDIFQWQSHLCLKLADENFDILLKLIAGLSPKLLEMYNVAVVSKFMPLLLRWKLVMMLF